MKYFQLECFPIYGIIPVYSQCLLRICYQTFPKLIGWSP